MAAVVSSDFMDREDVWMIEIGSSGSLLLESMKSIFVRCVFLTEDFDGNLTSELHVFGKVDHAHAARAELFKNPVMRNLLRFHLRLKAFSEEPLATKAQRHNSICPLSFYSLCLLCLCR